MTPQDTNMPKDTKKSLQQEIDEMNFKNEQAFRIRQKQISDDRLKTDIANRKKSSRGPSESDRIPGLGQLRGLNMRLGQQFLKTK